MHSVIPVREVRVVLPVFEVNDALVLVEAADRVHFLSGEAEVEQVDVLCYPLLVHGLRDGREATFEL